MDTHSGGQTCSTNMMNKHAGQLYQEHQGHMNSNTVYCTLSISLGSLMMSLSRCPFHFMIRRLIYTKFVGAGKGWRETHQLLLANISTMIYHYFSSTSTFSSCYYLSMNYYQSSKIMCNGICSSTYFIFNNIFDCKKSIHHDDCLNKNYKEKYLVPSVGGPSFSPLLFLSS